MGFFLWGMQRGAEAEQQGQMASSLSEAFLWREGEREADHGHTSFTSVPFVQGSYCGDLGSGKKGEKKKKKKSSLYTFLVSKGLFCLVKQPQTLPRLNGERQSSKTLYCPVTLVEKTRWCGESFS